MKPIKFAFCASILLATTGSIAATDYVAYLSGKRFDVTGTFGSYDFTSGYSQGVSSFDWAFVTTDGSVYQLQGSAPSDTNVFGWKVASVSAASITPSWHMFSTGSYDLDGDGSSKFDWILVSPENSLVFKLEGVNESGTFKYSESIAIDFSVSGDRKSVTFASQDSSSDTTTPGAPTASPITVSYDHSIPYMQIELSATDAEGDSLGFELLSSEDGNGYENAYIHPQKGILYISFTDDAAGTITLQYRVTDGSLYSSAADIKIEITDSSTEEPPTGMDENIDASTYGSYEIATFNTNLLGSPGSAPSTPTAVDLSPNFPTPGQQNHNDCVGWATAYAIKSYQEKLEEGWALNSERTIFSPLFVYNQINGGVDQGSQLEDAMQLITTKGIATLSTMPYDSGAYGYLTQPTSDAISEAQCYKASGYQAVRSISDIKAALANRQAVVGGVIVHKDLYNLTASDPVYDSKNLAQDGGHAIAIVGYDDNRYGGALKIINSWGTSFGENGFFWLPYNFAPEVLVAAMIFTDADNSCSVTTTTDDSVDTTDNTVDFIPPETADTSTLPNLTIDFWNAYYDEFPGGEGTLTWQISNTGSATAPKGASVSLMLSKDKKITNSDYYVVYDPLQYDLEPGYYIYRDEANSISFTIPNNIEPGQYYAALWVDDLDALEESDESDNKLPADSYVNIYNTLPDLSIENWWADWDLEGDGSLSYSIANIGGDNITQTGYYVGLYLSSDTTLDAYDYLLGWDSVDSSLPVNNTIDNSNYPVTFNIYNYWYYDSSSAQYYQGYIPAGVYYMGLWVDDLNQVEESNEYNNYSLDNYNYVTIHQNYNKKSATRGVAYNGKNISKKSVELRKVVIEKEADGSRSMRMLDRSGSTIELRADMLRPKTREVRKATTYTNRSAAKSIGARSNTIFPRKNGIAMPKVEK